MSSRVNIDINSVIHKALMDAGISPPKLCKVLIENWYASAQDDVLLIGKIVILEDKIAEIERKLKVTRNLEDELAIMKRELETLKSYQDEGREIGKRFKLLQYLNQRIVFYNYDKGVIMKKHGDVVKQLGDEFNLDEQIDKIKKINEVMVV
jgi:hypothetical protein